MTQITGRQKLLGGAALLAAVVWAVDWFAGGGRPAPAQASPSAAEQSSTTQPAWQDVNDLVARLTSRRYVPVADELDELPRDLFLPTPLIESALGRAEPEETDQPDQPNDSKRSEPDFASRHKLVGVMLGTAPVAVIDEHMVPLNTDFDGYTLTEIQRDYVVFSRPGGEDRVVLKLQPGPKTP
jgi:hypothetical protein